MNFGDAGSAVDEQISCHYIAVVHGGHCDSAGGDSLTRHAAAGQEDIAHRSNKQK